MVFKKELFFKTFRIFEEYFLLMLGIFVAGFGLEGFLIPSGFIDGGITGISLLVSFLTPISISILLFLFNIPFIILARKHIGRTFAMKALFAIIALAVLLMLIHYPIITSDKLLVAIFGGVLLGAGIGLAVRGGGVLDGTEILAIYLNRKIHLTIGEIIFIVNIIIFSFAAIFLGIETALYSVLAYLSAAKTIDFIIQGIEEYMGITVISSKSEEIRKKIVEDLGKGVTIYSGRRGYSEKGKRREIDIVFTVVTRLEVLKVKSEILAIDPHAVIIEQSIKEARGGIIKKRPIPGGN